MWDGVYLGGDCAGLGVYGVNEEFVGGVESLLGLPVEHEVDGFALCGGCVAEEGEGVGPDEVGTVLGCGWGEWAGLGGVGDGGGEYGRFSTDYACNHIVFAACQLRAEGKIMFSVQPLVGLGGPLWGEGLAGG